MVTTIASQVGPVALPEKTDAAPNNDNKPPVKAIAAITRTPTGLFGIDWDCMPLSRLPNADAIGVFPSDLSAYSASEESTPRKAADRLLCPQVGPLVKVELIQAVTSKLTIIHQAS